MACRAFNGAGTVRRGDTFAIFELLRKMGASFLAWDQSVREQLGLQRRKARDDAKRARQQTEQDKPTGGRRGELTPAKMATRQACTDDGTVERRKRMPGVNAEGKRHQGQTTILPPRLRAGPNIGANHGGHSVGRSKW